MVDKKLSVLADQLIAELLKDNGDFFSYKTVVCPNRNIRQWFKAYWLNNQKEILMNVNFVNLEEFLFSIFDTDYSLATSSDYKNLLIKLLTQKSYDQTYPEIKNYLFDEVNGNRVLNHTKVYELASTLTSLYIEYEKEMLSFTGWQKDLYDSLIKEFDKYQLTTLSKLYSGTAPVKVSTLPVYLFGFLSIDKLYKTILDKYSSKSPVVEFILEEEKELINNHSISSSPSISKEIEVVHSIICRTIKAGNGKPSDFLIVGKGMSEYENTIKKTFNQDDDKFPYIPYSISGSKSEDSDLTIALKLLLEIINKGFYTRLDFYSLICNNLIKNVRGITDEQIDKWMSSIHTLNVYRGDGDTNDDWDYIRKRMLLSKMSDVSFEDNIVVMNDEDTIPYSSIGLDNDSIIGFVSVIDDLKSWFELFANAKVTDKDTLLRFKNELKKWFCSPILSFVDKRYKKVDDLINYWIDKSIVAPINTLLFLLLDVSKLTSISYREPFTTGVTFVEFNENVVYSSKYVFFINCGSNVLPSKNIKSELDLGTSKNISEDEKRAFRSQYHNGAHVFFSFISMDLKKDAELFESTLSKEIRTELMMKDNPQGTLSDKDYKVKIDKLVLDDIFAHSIDETRKWEDLYTRGEYNKKDYREGLLSIKSQSNAAPSTPVDPQQEIQEVRTKVSVSDLAKLIQEPLSARANYLFGSDDDSNEKNHEEFEGFDLNALESYFILSALAELRVKHAKENPGVPFTTDQFKKELQLDKRLPNISEEIEDLTFELECGKADALLGSIGVETNPDEYELIRLPDLMLNAYGQDWILTCNKQFVRKEQSNTIDYYEFKNKSKDKKSKFLNLYVISLMDIASRKDKVTYTVNLHRFEVVSFEMDSQKAEDYLNRLYCLLNKYSEPYFAYLDFIKKKVQTFNKLAEYVVDENGPWAHFPYEKLFDKDTEIGYDRNNYKEEDYYDNQNEIVDLVEYVDTQVPDEPAPSGDDE